MATAERFELSRVAPSSTSFWEILDFGFLRFMAFQVRMCADFYVGGKVFGDAHREFLAVWRNLAGGIWLRASAPPLCSWAY